MAAPYLPPHSTCSVTHIVAVIDKGDSELPWPRKADDYIDVSPCIQKFCIIPILQHQRSVGQSQHEPPDQIPLPSQRAEAENDIDNTITLSLPWRLVTAMPLDLVLVHSSVLTLGGCISVLIGECVD